MANANVLMLYLWQFPNARVPQTTQEKWLVAGLMVIGVLLSIALSRQMREDARFLEQRKKPSELRGRRFLDRMAAGFSFQYPGALSLRGRDLRGEDLADAFLVDADLSETDLRGVCLRDADLERASLTQLIYEAPT